MAQSHLTVPEKRLILKILEGDYPRLKAENADQKERIKQLELAIIDDEMALNLAKKKEENDQKMLANWKLIVEELTPTWWDDVKTWAIRSIFLLGGYFLGAL